MIVNGCRSDLTEIWASAPCRIDMGGTIDISTFYLVLRHLDPCTFNAAIDLRTKVTLRPWENQRIHMAATGFEPAEFDAASAPFTHPLGLMFAICAHYGAEGIKIEIDTPGPPRAGLGGSSTAAVALGAALAAVGEKPTAANIARSAHAVEQAVAGVPCGMQDHLAAVYGGVHAWYWTRPANDRAVLRVGSAGLIRMVRPFYWPMSGARMNPGRSIPAGVSSLSMAVTAKSGMISLTAPMRSSMPGPGKIWIRRQRP